MKTFRLVWSPTGQEIAVVKARTKKAAIRKAPKPYSRYKGEIYAEEIGSNPNPLPAHWTPAKVRTDSHGRVQVMLIGKAAKQASSTIGGMKNPNVYSELGSALGKVDRDKQYGVKSDRSLHLWLQENGHQPYDNKDFAKFKKAYLAAIRRR